LSQHAVFLILGLANGSVYAALALALVVTYRSSGVINFATGAMAMVSAYVYADLRRGEILDPIPGLPHTFSIGGPMAFWPALVITVAVSAALGLFLYWSTFRPLRTASGVGKAVASLGVMVILTGLITQQAGTSPISVGSIFPSGTWLVGSIRMPEDRVWFAITVVLLTAVVICGYRFTRFGLHTRAAAETEKGAFVSHISPDRLSALNWIISAAIAGLAGVLIAPVTPLVPSSYTLFIVPALAAAIVGGFESIAIAVGAGLLMGMLQSETTYLQAQHTWLPQSGLAELIPLLLILVVLVIRAKPLPSRGEVARAALARAPRPEHLGRMAVIAGALGLVAILATSGNWRLAFVTSFIFGIIALSSVVVTGFAGQVSLAQLTIAGAAGFLLSPVTASWGVPFPIAPILAALGAAAIGVVVGIPALRIRGLPVAIVTLSLAVAVQAIWFENVSLVGTAGKTVTEPTLFGLALGPGTGAAYPRPAFCIMVLVVLILVALGVATIRRRPLGSAMLAVRANERSASASGINVVATKILAFGIAAFIAGIGGSLYAYRLGTVTFDSFDVLIGLGLFATIYVVGITSVSGGVLAGMAAAGGILSYVSSEVIRLPTIWYGILTGVGLVYMVITNPEGLTGIVHRWLDRRRAGQADVVSAALEAAPVSLAAALPRPEGIALSVSHIGVRYGGVIAVDDASFEVPRGAIVGLIGPNGAGKTTMIDAISGFTPYSGSVQLDGEPLDSLSPFRRIRRGLGRTFQGIELYPELTVEENVMVGPGASARSQEDSDALFALLQLDGLRHRPASSLSQGQRQLVSIARALVAQPSVLLLDEPAAGLDSTESIWLADRLREIRDSGVTILLVDHDMNLVLNLCDHIEVLDFGSVIASGTPTEIRSSSVVADAYLGASHAEPEAS
jgi:ABC-type branched-subunit amino acid transport system ATPase component/ABC-type branched-subunit amino acid transport system permease subunit